MGAASILRDGRYAMFASVKRRADEASGRYCNCICSLREIDDGKVSLLIMRF